MLKHGTSGFTLIELMIGIAILAVLISVALPEFSTWIQNTKIRTAAESVQTGLQLARAEAVRRNTNVQFAFTTGSGWSISVASTGEVVQSRAEEEGNTAGITVTRSPGTATRVTFNSLGRVTTNADASAALTQVVIDTPSLAAAKSRELRLNITTGGSIRMCDPNVTDSGDPRKC